MFVLFSAGAHLAISRRSVQYWTYTDGCWVMWTLSMRACTGHTKSMLATLYLLNHRYEAWGANGISPLSPCILALSPYKAMLSNANSIWKRVWDCCDQKNCHINYSYNNLTPYTPIGCASSNGGLHPVVKQWRGLEPACCRVCRTSALQVPSLEIEILKFELDSFYFLNLHLLTTFYCNVQA